MKSAIVLVLLFTLTTNAQQASPNADSAETVIALTQFTQADTVRALHNLFKSRRNTGGWLAGGSAAVTGIGVINTLASPNGKDCAGYFCMDALGTLIFSGILLAPAWIPGSISLVRFSNRKERLEIEKYEQTRTLPPYIKRRLSTRFFNTDYRFSKKN